MSILCTPYSRCNQWRECERCSRIRQAQIADVAEARLARNHYLTYIVLKTNSPLTLADDRKRFLRSVTRLSSGGIWTVEVGEEFRGLHVNLLVASERPLRESKIRKAWGDLGEVHSEPVLGWRDYWVAVGDQLDDRGRPVYAGQLDDLYTYWVKHRPGMGAGPGAAEFKEAGQSVRRLAAYVSKIGGIPLKENMGVVSMVAGVAVLAR